MHLSVITPWRSASIGREKEQLFFLRDPYMVLSFQPYLLFMLVSLIWFYRYSTPKQNIKKRSSSLHVLILLVASEITSFTLYSKFSTMSSYPVLSFFPAYKPRSGISTGAKVGIAMAVIFTLILLVAILRWMGCLGGKHSMYHGNGVYGVQI